MSPTIIPRKQFVGRPRTYAQNCTVALVFGRGRPVEGADLRRFDKHKKTSPVRNCTFFFVVHKALKYGWVSIPNYLILYTNGVAE